jgi:hypothetical protein
MNALYHAIEEVVAVFAVAILYLTSAVHGNLLPCEIWKMPAPTKIFPSATVEIGERNERWSYTSVTSPAPEETPVNETLRSPTTERPTIEPRSSISEVPPVTETPEPENYRERIILSYDCEYIVKNKVHMGHIYLYASHLLLDLPLKKKQKKYPLTVRHHLSFMLISINLYTYMSPCETTMY